MNRVRLHAAANTKALAIMGDFLLPEDYLAILEMDRLDEILQFLSQRVRYQDLLAGETDPIETYEIKMKRVFFETYEKIYHFYVGPYRTFFMAMFMRYDVENLKLFARVISRGESLANIKQNLIFSELYASVDYSRILVVENMQDFVEALKGTMYHDLIVWFLEEDPIRMNFRLEMSLDRLYFQKLYQSILKLDRMDRKLMGELLGANIDMLNLQWIYRGRRFFDISAEEIYNFTLDHGAQYNLRRLKDLCYMDFDKYREFILEGSYGDLFKDREYMLERGMERHLFYEVRKMMKANRMSLAIPVGILFLFEYEIRDLFTIMEGKRYKFQDLQSLLIRDFERV